MDSVLYYLFKAIRSPEKAWLGIWVFGQLWWIDRHLQAFGCEALKDSVPSSLPTLDQALIKTIRLRAGYIEWIGSFHPCRPLCLHRSLVLYRWLRQQGIAARLEIGWSNRIGHAWVTYDGLVLNDRPDVVERNPLLTRVRKSS
jgi:Transglutaminase-like superfamily